MFVYNDINEQMFWGDNMKKIKIADKKRFVFSIILMVFISLIIIMTLASRNKAYSTKYEEKYLEMTVARGDTLWGIALNNKPDSYDTREIVYEIMMVNNLKDSKISPGDVIKIPIKTDK